MGNYYTPSNAELVTYNIVAYNQQLCIASAQLCHIFHLKLFPLQSPHCELFYSDTLFSYTLYTCIFS